MGAQMVPVLLRSALMAVLFALIFTLLIAFNAQVIAHSAMFGGMRLLRWNATLCAIVTVGFAAQAFAAPRAYIANHGDNTVSIIDTATNLVVGTIPVGRQPYGVAMDPEGAHVYVGNFYDGTVSIIATSTHDVVTLPVTDAPTGIAVKLPGTRVYVAHRNDQLVSVIDTATNQVLTTVGVGAAPMGIAVHPAGTPAYVVNRGDDTMSVIDTNTNEVVATVPVGSNPTHVAVSPIGDQVYVTDNVGARVTVVNASTLDVTGTISVGAYPEGVAFSPDGSRAYVVNSGPETLSVIDTQLEKLITNVPVGRNAEDVAVHPDGTRVYVMNRGERSISVIDAATNHEIDLDGDAATGMTRITVGVNPVARGQALIPALGPPRFSKSAIGCQAAIAAQGQRFVKMDAGARTACEAKLLADVASGKGMEADEATCALALDLQNPRSALSQARTSAHHTIVKKCTGVAVSALHGPCTHDATSFSETATCVLADHENRVREMVGDLSVGDPAKPLTKGARACLAAISKGATQLARSAHAQLDGCLVRALKNAAKEKSLAMSAVGCRSGLDPIDPKAMVTKVRASALAKIAKQCSGLGPLDIGAPCDPTATTIAQTTACAFASHTMRVEKMVAAEFNDACPLLTAVGLARVYPDVCSGH